jgi:hypothetical protein
MSAAPVTADSLRGRFVPVTALAIGAAMSVIVTLARPRDGGPLVFFEMADKVASGLVPYRDFVLEYPPLALVPLVFPRLISGTSQDAFTVPFTLVAIAITLATGAAVAWLAGHGWSSLSRNGSIIAFAALFFAAAPQVLWRFDIFAAMFTALALIAVASNRPGWAGFALALGAATKLYPAFLVPVIFAYYAFGRRWRSSVMVVFGFAVLMVALAGLLILIAGRDAFTFLSYQQDRGFEIESVVAGLAMLAHNLFRARAVVTFGFGSFEVESPLIASLTGPNAVLMLGLGTLLAVCLAYSFDREWRRFGTVLPMTLVNYLLATLLLVMLANKVLSPQYICWLLPFGALLPWRKTALLLAICLLTTMVYPLLFDDLRRMRPLAVDLLNVRNLLLLAMFIWLVIPSWGRIRTRTADDDEGQMDAMFEMPPSNPAATPNISSPIASFFRRGAISTISRAATPTVATLARVRPGKPDTFAS